MFDRYTQQRDVKRRGPLAFGSVVVHLIIGVGLAIAGWWEVHELTRPNRGVAMAASIQPSSSGAKTKASTKLKRRVKLVRDTRQPDKRRTTKAKLANAGSQQSESSETGSDGAGDAVGTGNGPRLGVVGALCLDPARCQAELPKLALPKKVETTKTLPPTVLSELVRVAGNPQVQPPTPTQSAMRRLHQERIIAVVKMCLDREGQVSHQKIVKSSEYAEYDAKLLSNIRRWKYQPYRANGRALPICTHVTFIYQQEE